MNTYLTRSPVSHDGTLYEVGANIALTEERAKPLLACGAIEAMPMTVTEAEACIEATPMTVTEAEASIEATPMTVTEAEASTAVTPGKKAKK